jgi:glycosyltransferase involved in cell wall biosynthesis
MVTTFYPPYNFGGDGLYVRRLTHALAARGHSVDVIHDTDAYTVLGGAAKPSRLVEPPGVTVHGLRSAIPALSVLATQQLGYPVAHGRTIRRILRRGFDVIHFHNVSLVGGPGVLAYGEAVKLYTTHEHWLVCPMHILWRHNRELCTGRQCVRCSIAHRRPPQLWRLTDLLARKAQHVDAFLSLSRSCADNHRRFGFELPMRVTPSFLPDRETDDDAPSRPMQGASRYFLAVGRLERIKGLQDVIPLFDSSVPAELWIVGEGNYERELRRLAAGRTGVKFLGRRTPAELRGLYRGAVATIAASVCYEVFPMVVLESFREGTPVIARRLGPFPEIIEQSNGGLLFATDADLRSAIGAMLHEETRDRFGSEAQAAFQSRWSERVAIDAYLRLIGELARERGRTDIEMRAAPAPVS